MPHLRWVAETMQFSLEAALLTGLSTLLTSCVRESHEGDTSGHVIQYVYAGQLVHRLPDGSEVVEMVDREGCAVTGRIDWIEGSGLQGPSSGDFYMRGFCQAAVFFLPSDWQQPPGTCGWPLADEVVAGEFALGEAGERTTVSLDYTVTLLEAMGDLPCPPEEPLEDYAREFTVTAALDCADAPELECEGTWSIELEARITAEDVRPLN